MTRSELLGVLLAGGGMLVLGSSFAVSSLLVGYPPLASQALRYVLATAALVLIARQRGVLSARLSWIDLGWLCAVALTGLVGFNLFLLAALGESEPAAVGVIVGCSPLVLASVGPLLDGRLPSGRLIVAAAMVSLGAVVAQGGGATTPWGVVYALLTLVCEAAFSLLAIPVLHRLGPLRVSTCVCGIAGLMLAVAAIVVDGSAALPVPTADQVGAVLYLALVLTVGAFLAWYSAVGRLGVERAGLFVGLVPVSALVGGIVLGTGAFSPTGLVGAILVGSGVVLGISGPRPSGRAVAGANEPGRDQSLPSPG
jgi:drug/metabolite transporter (DMT)-like permease